MDGPLREIARGIYLVRPENDGRFPYSYSYLLKGKRNILIDAGAGKEVLKNLLAEVGIDLILISHPHGDHFAHLSVLPNIPVIIPRMKWETVRSFDLLGKRFIPDNDAVRKVWRAFIETILTARPFEPDGTFREGDTFSTGNHELVAISTPGHTADHFSFFEVRTGTVFAADIDLTPFGPWYGHQESEIDDFLFSLKRLKDLKGKMLTTSHFPSVAAPYEEHLDRYGEHIGKRDEAIRSLHGRGLSLDEMVARSPIYNGHPHLPELLAYFERVMIKKHLARMGLSI